VAISTHVELLKRGAKAWNEERPHSPDLSGAELRGLDISEAQLGRADLGDRQVLEANLRDVDLSQARLVGTYLRRADLGGANLQGANLRGADLIGANLSRANLEGATLDRAHLTGAHFHDANLNRASLRDAFLSDAGLARATLIDADLTEAGLVRAELVDADLTGANLTKATLFKAHLSRTNLTRARLHQVRLDEANFTETVLDMAELVDASVYGVSAWNIRGVPAVQRALRITRPDEPPVTVDDLEVAQFMHLMIRNPKIRDVLDTLTRKVVLILGRFSPARHAVLEALRDALRERGLVPVIFDFDKPESLSLTETVTLLARMARFIVADLTDPSSVPYELARIAPDVRVPIHTIIQRGQREFAMFKDLSRAYRWVADPLEYDDIDLLCASLDDSVIAVAEATRLRLNDR
jgi:uncharacterized protein YjbI with pentapeptide repeats